MLKSIKSTQSIQFTFSTLAALNSLLRRSFHPATINPTYAIMKRKDKDVISTSVNKSAAYKDSIPDNIAQYQKIRNVMPTISINLQSMLVHGTWQSDRQ